MDSDSFPSFSSSFFVMNLSLSLTDKHILLVLASPHVILGFHKPYTFSLLSQELPKKSGAHPLLSPSKSYQQVVHKLSPKNVTRNMVNKFVPSTNAKKMSKS